MEIEQISIEQFNELGGNGRGRKKHPTMIAIEAMETGTAMIIDHYGKCGKANGRVSCTMMSAISWYSRNHKTKFYSGRHLPDGRMAIACLARQEPDPVV